MSPRACESQRAGIERVAILGKMNGAVGNFNAHVAALPQVDWPAFSARIRRIARPRSRTAYTTQIEPHDWIAEYCHALMRANTVLLDLCARHVELHLARAISSSGWSPAKSAPRPCRTRSTRSTSRMPKAISGLANALLGHFADKLPVSRLQRDLTDSTVLRNLGVAIGHCGLELPVAERRPAERSSSTQATGRRGPGPRLGGAGRGGANCDARPRHSRRLRYSSKTSPAAGPSMSAPCANSSPRWSLPRRGKGAAAGSLTPADLCGPGAGARAARENPARSPPSSRPKRDVVSTAPPESNGTIQLKVRGVGVEAYGG